MIVWASVILVVLIIFFLMACGVSLGENDPVSTVVFFLIGFLLIMILVISPNWNPSGLPLNDIDPGTYKIAQVYVAGDNVNIAIEWKKNEKSIERIYYYQFKQAAFEKAFEGVLNPNAKKLVVVQSGSFKKLRLE